MRVRNVEKIFDRVFWMLLLIAPIIAFFIAQENNSVTLITVLEQFNVTDTNIVYTTLASIFGTGGTLEFFNTVTSNVVLMYMSYLVIIELVHIVVDVLIFLPRIIVKMLDRAVEIGDTTKWKD